MSHPLVIIESHPVQYHAPVYREVARAGVPLVVLYGSDFSVVGYRDREFNTQFAWDIDLLSGYGSVFLSRTSEGGASNADAVSAENIDSRLKALKPAAVMLVGYASTFDRGATLAAKRLGKPILFRAETTDHAKKRSWLKQVIRDWKLRRFYRTCSRLLYIGERSLAHYRRLGVPDSKLILSPYCVDASQFQTDESARTAARQRIRVLLDISEDRLALLFSGKIVHRKGVDLLVPAVKALPLDLAERVVLVFLGDGNERESIAATASSQGVDVRFVGFQNQSLLSNYYHGSDCLVLPSRLGETWGLVVNEALQHGLPVIASDAVGCVPDLVKPGITGEVFASGSINDLADAIQRVAKLVGSPKVRDQCRSTMNKYTISSAAAGIITAFRAL